MRILVWTRIPNHYQRALFKECVYLLKDDFKVVYFAMSGLQRRLEQGWTEIDKLESHESQFDPNDDLNTFLEDINWRQYIHIIPGNCSALTASLIDLCIKNNVQWCHWSERSGARLNWLLRYNNLLFDIISPWFFRLYKRRYAKIINKHALGVFAQGKLADENFQIWGVKKEKIAPLYYTSPPLISKKEIAGIKPFINGKRVFIYCGALCKRKGIDLLVKAFSKLRAENWVMIIVGLDKENGKYEKLVERLSLKDKVMFTGAVPVNDIVDYVNMSDVVILSSRFDGWGIILNEAASLGKALISTDQCGAAWHLIEANENGFRVKAGSAGALSDAMQRYVENTELIEQHGEASRKLFFDKYTPAINASNMVSAIKKWLNN